MKKILILTNTIWERDPRVLKHFKYLQRAGYDVVIGGLSGEIRFYKKIIYFLFMLFGFFHGVLKFKFNIIKYYIPGHFKPDIVLVNDWVIMPLASDFIKSVKTKLVYDIHEFSTDGYIRSLRMKLTVIPAAKKIERNYIYKADLVTTVCDSIADRLYDMYHVKAKVIRNCPDTIKISDTVSKTEYPIKLYHHGGYNKSRKLENFIDAVLNFQDKYLFYIRLSGEFGDIRSIKSRYQSYKNIIFLDPVEVENLTKSAIGYDIGVSYIYPSNYNNLISLSNKFFEYIIAGLVGFIGPSPEMKKIIEKHDIGFITNSFTSCHIRKKLDEITCEKVDEKKLNVLKYRDIYTSDNEWGKLINYIEDIL